MQSPLLYRHSLVKFLDMMVQLPRPIAQGIAPVSQSLWRLRSNSNLRYRRRATRSIYVSPILEWL